MPSADAGSATAIAYDPASKYYFMGGTFTDFGLRSASGFSGQSGGGRQKLVAVNAESGAISSFNPGIDATSIDVLKVSGGKLYIGGQFTAVAGVVRTGLARFTLGANGTASLDSSFDPKLDSGSRVFDVEFTDDGVIVGGKLSNMVANRGGVVKLNSTTGDVDSSFAFAGSSFGGGTRGGTVQTLKRSGSTLWVGGDFDDNNVSAELRAASGTINDAGVGTSVTRSGIAKLSIINGQDQGWSTGALTQPNSTNRCGTGTTEGTTVYDLEAVSSTRLLVAGCFTGISDGNAGHLASGENIADLSPTSGEVSQSFRTSTYSGSGSYAQGPIFDIAVDSTYVYLGGNFNDGRSSPTGALTCPSGDTECKRVLSLTRVGLNGGAIGENWTPNPVGSGSIKIINSIAGVTDGSGEFDQLAVGGPFVSINSEQLYAHHNVDRRGFATFSRSPVTLGNHQLTANGAVQIGTTVSVQATSPDQLWMGSPGPSQFGAYKFRWYHCTNVQLGSCVGQSQLFDSGTVTNPYSASGLTHTLDASDAGQYLQLEIEASNSNTRTVSGTTASLSNYYGPVQKVNGPPTVGSPTLEFSDETPKPGTVVTCMRPSNPTAPTGSTFAYSWSVNTAPSTLGAQFAPRSSVAGHADQYELTAGDFSTDTSVPIPLSQVKCSIVVTNPSYSLSATREVTSANPNLINFDLPCPIAGQQRNSQGICFTTVVPSIPCADGQVRDAGGTCQPISCGVGKLYDASSKMCVNDPTYNANGGGKDGKDGRDADALAALSKSPPKFQLALGSAKRIKFNKSGKAKLTISVTNVNTALWLSTTFKSFRAKPKKGVYKSKAIPGAKITASSEKLTKNGTVTIKLTASKGLRKVLGKKVLGNAKVSLVAGLASGANAATAPKTLAAYRSAGLKVNMQSPKVRVK